MNILKINNGKVELRKDSVGFEREIDELVYKLYDITVEEQKIIEGN